MGRISVELVPRSDGSFVEEMISVREKFPCIDTLNIPDILKFDMRIPQACETANPYFKHIIPHLRAVSVSRDEPFPYKDIFEEQGVDEALVILGDNPEIVSRSEAPCTSTELIRKIKEEMPGMKVYAGIDQWRTTLEEEMEYALEKTEAGADGFFTQPFFDLDLMEKYSRRLEHTEVFWGLAPVIRPSSREYWETKNKVVFPDDFECTMDWNQKFAREVLRRTDTEKFHVYFCPITVDVVAYLTGVI